MNKELTRQEVSYLCALIDAEKSTIDLLRGFRKPNREEQDKKAYFNNLKGKLNKILIENK